MTSLASVPSYGVDFENRLPLYLLCHHTVQEIMCKKLKQLIVGGVNCVCVYVCMYACVLMYYVCVYVCVCMCVCVYVCVYVCMYVCTEPPTHEFLFAWTFQYFCVHFSNL